MTNPGSPRPSLADLLLAEPWRFDFFQAVRLLGRLRRAPGTVGGDSPRREVVRFVAHQSLAFPASAIHDLRPLPSPEPGASPVLAMTVAFLGLTGPKGILPLPYTVELRRRVRAGDDLSAAFLDLFNHRLVALFYRAGEKYRLGGEEGTGESNRTFDDALLALAGLGPSGALTRDRLPFDDRRLLLQAGLFTRQVRTAEGLAAVIAGAIGIEVEVRQFVPRWVEIDPEFRGRLGGPGGGDRGAGLGQGFVIGSRYLDVQGKFRLRVGPLSFSEYRRLLPGTPLRREVVELTRLYVGPSLVFDLELILRADEVPRARLGGGAEPPALGRTTWASAGPRAEDAAVLVAAGPWPGGAEQGQPGQSTS